MEFGAKCISIWNKQVLNAQKSKLNIPNMWLISFDHVTYVFDRPVGQKMVSTNRTGIFILLFPLNKLPKMTMPKIKLFTVFISRCSMHSVLVWEEIGIFMTSQPGCWVKMNEEEACCPHLSCTIHTTEHMFGTKIWQYQMAVLGSVEFYRPYRLKIPSDHQNHL